jgi:hypothetical protein
MGVADRGRFLESLTHLLLRHPRRRIAGPVSSTVQVHVKFANPFSQSILGNKQANKPNQRATAAESWGQRWLGRRFRHHSGVKRSGGVAESARRPA